MIEVDGVTRKFGDKVAVNNLSLTVPRGELFCFLGPNGAGKTTTIKMICGLLRPTHGEIRIAGRRMEPGAVDVRKTLGYIPDTPFLYERLTPAEFIEFTADLYQVPSAEAARNSAELMSMFGLEEYQHVLIKDLSHGLRQRVSYAATLMHNPDVLLVDEPFIGLDPYSIRMIRDLLREKARKGMTILLTTHILALAEDMADRVGIISNGSLVAIGTVNELLVGQHQVGRLEDLFLRLTRTDGGTVAT